MIQQVVVLAGGLASRLAHHAERLPKALQPVAGRPFVDHQLELLASQDFRRVLMCVGHLGEQIVRHVGNGRQFGLEVEYAFDGPVRLGTAGAIRATLGRLDERFAVEYGDTYLRAPVADISGYFESSGKLALMTVYRNDNTLEPSNVVLEGQDIVLYDKRVRDPRMRHIDFGLSFFRREAFDRLLPAEPSDLADLFVNLLREGQLGAFEVPERFYEIGTPHALAESNLLLSALLQRSQPRSGI